MSFDPSPCAPAQINGRNGKGWLVPIAVVMAILPIAVTAGIWIGNTDSRITENEVAIERVSKDHKAGLSEHKDLALHEEADRRLKILENEIAIMKAVVKALTRDVHKLENEKPQ